MSTKADDSRKPYTQKDHKYRKYMWHAWVTKTNPQIHLFQGYIAALH
jgi:hypothetical protein